MSDLKLASWGYLGASGKTVPHLTVQPLFCLAFHHIRGYSKTIESFTPFYPRKVLALTKSFLTQLKRRLPIRSVARPGSCFQAVGRV